MTGVAGDRAVADRAHRDRAAGADPESRCRLAERFEADRDGGSRTGREVVDGTRNQQEKAPLSRCPPFGGGIALTRSRKERTIGSGMPAARPSPGSPHPDSAPPGSSPPTAQRLSLGGSGRGLRRPSPLGWEGVDTQ